MTDAELELLEFWPDYGTGPLWLRGGKPADLAALAIPADLGSYEEERLPLDGDGDGDAEYLALGVRLLEEVRAALTGKFRVVVTEP